MLKMQTRFSSGRFLTAGSRISGQRFGISKYGFTLVELLVVIAIMGSITALVVPVMRGGADLNKVAWNLSGTIEQARAYAMAQNTYVWLAINNAEASTALQSNTAVFVVASRDGSSSTAATNLIQLGKTEMFENLILSGSIPAYGNRPAAPTQVAQLSVQPMPSPAITLPGPLAARFKTNKIIKINPDGSAWLPNPGNAAPNNWQMVQWIEIGLQATQGTLATSRNTAVVQEGGLTGQVRIFRP